MIFGGDFCQILPFSLWATKHQILESSSKNSKLWKFIFYTRTCAWSKLQKVLDLPSFFLMLVLGKIQTLMDATLKLKCVVVMI